MGVVNLWSVLEDTKAEIPISDLSGASLAVDLSLWLCECSAQSVKVDSEVLPKLYVRNVFFRTVHLLRNGIRPIFVVDGTAPDLKIEAMKKRSNVTNIGTLSRPRLRHAVSECCTLFKGLGVPYFKSKGEAEALCACLDKAGLVDGCMLNDGDAFLYGAQTIYRNFAVTSKVISRYKLSEITDRLDLDRCGLIAFAVLTGCDYNTAGVFGVGSARALDFVKYCASNDLNPIETLRVWLGDENCKKRKALVEAGEKKMAALCEKMQLGMEIDKFEKTVAEFLENQADEDICEAFARRNGVFWDGVNVEAVMDFLKNTLQWSRNYSVEQLLPLLAKYTLNEGLKCENQDKLPFPTKIVKRKTLNKQECFEVVWSWVIDIESSPCSSQPNCDFTTVEPVELFSSKFTRMAAEFDENETKRKSRQPAKKRTSSQPIKPNQSIIPYLKPTERSNSLDDLIENLENVHIDNEKNGRKSPKMTADEFFGITKPGKIEKPSTPVFKYGMMERLFGTKQPKRFAQLKKFDQST